jgi:opacity protein-like surface antigen
MLKLLPTLGAVAVSVLLFGSPVRAQNAAGEPSPDPSPPTADSKADPAVDPPKRQASDQPPTGVNKVRNFIETNPIVQSFKGDGFYPRVGGLSQGSGLAGGAGFRRHLGWTYVDVSGAISTKAYRGIDAQVRWIDTPRFQLATLLTFRNNTQDDFYGLGNETTDATRVDYGIRWTDIGARGSVRIVRGLRLGADVGYFIPAVRHGRDQNVRSIAQLFSDATAPGLARQPDFEHHSVFAVIDGRDAEGFPRRGGVYRGTYAIWNDQSFGAYNFRRFDMTGAQFFSLPTRSVLAVRLALSYTNNEPGDRVPFYLLPYVGGGDTVRSFREFRFRDENAGVFNMELRHKIHSMAYVAGFVDFGKVAHDWQDITPTDLKKAYGVGLRGGTDAKTYFRLDVAYGDGGTRVFLKLTPSF